VSHAEGEIDKQSSSPPSKRSPLHCTDEPLCESTADTNDADVADDNYVTEPVSAPLVFHDVNGIYAAIRSATNILPSVPCKEQCDARNAHRRW